MPPSAPPVKTSKPLSSFGWTAADQILFPLWNVNFASCNNGEGPLAVFLKSVEAFMRHNCEVASSPKESRRRVPRRSGKNRKAHIRDAWPITEAIHMFLPMAFSLSAATKPVSSIESTESLSTWLESIVAIPEMSQILMVLSSLQLATTGRLVHQWLSFRILTPKTEPSWPENEYSSRPVIDASGLAVLKSGW